MESYELRERLLAAEKVYLRNQIVDQLCRWRRCRDDKDLLSALGVVKELVDLEDLAAALKQPSAQ